MNTIKFLLIWLLLLSSLATFRCGGYRTKTPLPYPELIQKKPKIKETLLFLLHEQDETKRRDTVHKLVELMKKAPPILPDYDAITGISEVEIELIKSDNRPPATIFNADDLFNSDTLARHQPFPVSKEKGTRYALLYVEDWIIFRVTDWSGNPEGFVVVVIFDIFLLDRETESLLFHTHLFEREELKSQASYDVFYQLAQQVLEEARRSLTSLVRVPEKSPTR